MAAGSKSHSGLWAVAAGVVGLMLGLALGAGFMWTKMKVGAAQEMAGPEMEGPPPATVKVGTATMQPLRDRVDVTGRLREVRRVTVTSEVEAKLVALNVEAGDAVVGGETVLAQIDPVWTQRRYESAQAAVAEAEAELAQARSDLAQLEDLESAGSAKQKEVGDARTAVAANEARLAAAQAEIARVTTERERLTIVAPFDGVVTRKLAEVGQWCSEGDGVVEIVSRGRIDAVVDVPERSINAVQEIADSGAEVALLIEATGEEVFGQVVAVTPDGTNASRTFPVKIRLDDQNGALRPGMSVVAKFPLGQPRPFLTVPRDAVLFSAMGDTVWVAMDSEAPDGMPMALPAPVRVRFGVDDRFAVEVLGDAPLFPSATVIVEGQESVFPTQPLMIPEREVGSAKSDDATDGTPPPQAMDASAPTSTPPTGDAS